MKEREEVKSWSLNMLQEKNHKWGLGILAFRGFKPSGIKGKEYTTEKKRL